LKVNWQTTFQNLLPFADAYVPLDDLLEKTSVGLLFSFCAHNQGIQMPGNIENIQDISVDYFVPLQHLFFKVLLGGLKNHSGRKRKKVSVSIAFN